MKKTVGKEPKKIVKNKSSKASKKSISDNLISKKKEVVVVEKMERKFDNFFSFPKKNFQYGRSYLMITSFLMILFLFSGFFFPGFLKGRTNSNTLIAQQSSWSGGNSNETVPFRKINIWDKYYYAKNIQTQAGISLLDSANDGELSSSVYDTGVNFSDLALRVEANNINNQNDIDIQIKYSADGSKWSDWVNSSDRGNYSWDISGQGRYFQYKITILKTNGLQSPEIKKLFFLTGSNITKSIDLINKKSGSYDSITGDINVATSDSLVRELTMGNKKTIEIKEAMSPDKDIFLNENYNVLKECDIYSSEDTMSHEVGNTTINSEFTIKFNYPNNPNYQNLAVYQDWNYQGDFNENSDYYDINNPNVSVTPTSFSIKIKKFGNFVLVSKGAKEDIKNKNSNNIEVESKKINDLVPGLSIKGTILDQEIKMSDQNIKVNKTASFDNKGKDVVFDENISLIIPDKTVLLFNEKILEENGNLLFSKPINQTLLASDNFPENFLAKSDVISFGSEKESILMSNPATIIFPQEKDTLIAYKPYNSQNWLTIESKCDGEYSNPLLADGFPLICYIDSSDGANKKVLTNFTAKFILFKNKDGEKKIEKNGPAPSNTEITINKDAGRTSSKSVELTLKADNAIEMMISEDKDFSRANWEGYAMKKIYTLSDGLGLKTVYVKFRSESQKESTYIYRQIILEK